MLFNKPMSLKHYKTGTKLYTAELTDTGKDVFVLGKMEVRAPAEYVIAYYMCHAVQFTLRDENGVVKCGRSHGSRGGWYRKESEGSLPSQRALYLLE